MSVESAKAFCVRMMSDEDFRNVLGSATCACTIAETVKKEYDFSREDLLKVISELTGKKVAMEELKAMVCEVYEEEINTEGKGSSEAVAAWLDSLS